MCGFMCGLGTQMHAVFERLTMLETESPCWRSIWQEGVLERPQQTTVSPDSVCYYMNTGGLHGGFKWKFVQTNHQASHAIYFVEVHRTCVESVDQVDTCCETKYLSSQCILMSAWNADSRCRASYARLVPSKLSGTDCIHVVTVTVRTLSCSLWPFKDSFLSYWAASSTVIIKRRLSPARLNARRWHAWVIIQLPNHT